MKRIALLILIIILFGTENINASGRRPDAKPSSPLSLSILPEDETLDPGALKTGDTLRLVVTCRSLAAGKNLVIEVSPRGSVEVVEGETIWEGGIDKNGEVVIAVTVKVTGKGAGVVQARATMREGKSFVYSAHASFKLRPEPEKKKDALRGEVKRDYRGRDIIEYRQGGDE